MALTYTVDKVHNKTGMQLSPATMACMQEGCPLVCWSSNSKYFLFVFEMVGSNDYDINVRCTGLGVNGVKRLEWASRKELTTQAG